MHFALQPWQDFADRTAYGFLGLFAPAGTSVRIANGNSVRLRLYVCVLDDVDYAATSTGVALSDKPDGLTRPFAVVSNVDPRLVLTLEEYGNVLLGDIYAQSLGGGAVTISVGELVQRR